MNKELHTQFFNEDESSMDIKKEVFRYLRYWPWFIGMLFLCLVSGYFFIRYSPKVFETKAKIKILDEGKGLELPTSAFIFNRSKINLENETEIISSYRILEKVAAELNLTSSFYEVGNIQTTQVASLPFYYKQLIPSESIEKGYSYEIKTTEKGFRVINNLSNEELVITNHDSFVIDHNLPFEVKVDSEIQLEDALNKTFIIRISPLKTAVLALKSALVIETIGESSHLLTLSMKSVSKERSETVLNKIIDVFNNDGIKDRQLVSKRTLDFIDDRFVFLAKELDSIEINKKDFKQENDLVYLETDTELSLGQQTQAEEEVFRVENQLAIVGLIENALNSGLDNELLPANIGVENTSINTLINEYNIAVLERSKLVSSGGVNNPSVQLINGTLIGLKRNINSSIASYKSQLQLSRSQLASRSNRYKSEVLRLPEKEKLLRAIERQQKIKESLYLLLLQKREEAAINLAITEPSVKVVEHALSGSFPISPKTRIVYAAAVLLGLLLPFGFLYVMFMFDTKLHDKKDIEAVVTDIPVAAEIPKIKKDVNNHIFSNPNDRTALAESFRILSSNVKFMLPEQDKGQVIYCTSTIKGEGKTFVSLNLSLALSSLNKKVLLIGADLRNPQLHTYLNEKKDKAGLSNYLHDTKVNWKNLVIKGFKEHPNHDILISGSLPPNPAHLLTNGRLETLLEEAKTVYDYIIVDTAPTILVTDTLLISQYADATLYITRANFTEKNLLDHSIELSKNKKLKNLAYVINSVGDSNRSYGYNYGYNYGYTEET